MQEVWGRMFKSVVIRTHQGRRLRPRLENQTELSTEVLYSGQKKTTTCPRQRFAEAHFVEARFADAHEPTSIQLEGLRIIQIGQQNYRSRRNFASQNRVQIDAGFTSAEREFHKTLNNKTIQRRENQNNENKDNMIQRGC